MADIAENLGNKLREKRKELGLSQTDLARLIGISQPAVARIENGKQNLSVDTIEKFTKALGVDLKIKLKPVTD